MASEPRTTSRDAALRQLLVDRVDATAPRGHELLPGRAAAERPRLRTTLVTAFVSAGVVAVSAAALVLSQSPHPAPASGAVTAAPTSAAPAPTSATATTPDPSSVTRLIAHKGWHEITRDQLHAYVISTSWGKDDPADGAIWEEQAWLDMQCMATKGYLYDPISEGSEVGTTAADSGLTAEQLQGYNDAMYGPQTDAPYDWRTAGCHGISVHETGQDDAH